MVAFATNMFTWAGVGQVKSSSARCLPRPSPSERPALAELLQERGVSRFAAMQSESAVLGFIGQGAIGVLDNRHFDWLCLAIGCARGRDRIALTLFRHTVE